MFVASCGRDQSWLMLAQTSGITRLNSPSGQALYMPLNRTHRPWNVCGSICGIS